MMKKDKERMSEVQTMGTSDRTNMTGLMLGLVVATRKIRKKQP